MSVIKGLNDNIELIEGLKHDENRNVVHLFHLFILPGPWAARCVT